MKTSMEKSTLYFLWFIFPVALLAFSDACGQYVHRSHRVLTESDVAVDRPGYYGKEGTTYVLTQDITSAKSAIFLGKNITLDLNGYSITYADGDYQHIPNYSFEEGFANWDISKAPSAKIEDKKVHVFIGDKIMRLKAGEEITSQYINISVVNRSYFAMCGVIRPDMRVSVYVEDAEGNSIICSTSYSDTIMVSSPIEKRSPRLGGGFVYAHLTGLSAGKYRIRVKADTDCLVDHIDLRPSMDVGIGIVEDTHPMGHNDHLYERAHSAFFDYTEDVSRSKPVVGIPIVTGEGTVTIKNGIIRNGTVGVLSWGIQSTAEDVRVILDNVKIITSGINTTAVDVPHATITRSTFDVTSPFIINRHGSEFYGVDLRGDRASEVSYSEFYGGQGCLVFKGNFSKIHHNLFVNRQTVTNHYSIMAMGDSSQIFENVIKPEMGSGIEVYVHRGMEIFNNEIWIKASPPTCEYGHEDYSTTAIRIADYNAQPGAPNGCFGNKVYNNKMHITGMDYPAYADYIPMAWAVFYSASGGDNYIFGNEIIVDDMSLGSKNETSAFYIGGGSIGGHFYDNHIRTNVPAAWVASRYGAANHTRIYNNTIVKSATADDSFKPFRMGWDGYQDCVAKDIQFRSNYIVGAGFGIDATDQGHSYSVYWTLDIKVTNKKGKLTEGAEIKIFDRNGKIVNNSKSTATGLVRLQLPEYFMKGLIKEELSPYTVNIGRESKIVILSQNSELTLTIP